MRLVSIITFLGLLAACDGPYPAQIVACQEACQASGVAMQSVGNRGCTCQPQVCPGGFVEAP